MFNAAMVSLYHYIDGLRAGWWGFDFRYGQEIFSSPSPDQLWGPPNLISSGYWGALTLEVKRTGREADRSPSPSAEVE
jgi:hypothetical protein